MQGGDADVLGDRARAEAAAAAVQVAVLLVDDVEVLLGGDDDGPAEAVGAAREAAGRVLEALALLVAGAGAGLALVGILGVRAGRREQGDAGELDRAALGAPERPGDLEPAGALEHRGEGRTDRRCGGRARREHEVLRRRQPIEALAEQDLAAVDGDGEPVQALPLVHVSGQQPVLGVAAEAAVAVVGCQRDVGEGPAALAVGGGLLVVVGAVAEEEDVRRAGDDLEPADRCAAAALVVDDLLDEAVGLREVSDAVVAVVVDGDLGRDVQVAIAGGGEVEGGASEARGHGDALRVALDAEPVEHRVGLGTGRDPHRRAGRGDAQAGTGQVVAAPDLDVDVDRALAAVTEGLGVVAWRDHALDRGRRRLVR